MKGKPVCMKKLPWACSFTLVVIERMTASSSTTLAICGNMLLTGMPLWPAGENLNGLAMMAPLLLNCVRSTFTGIGLP